LRRSRIGLINTCYQHNVAIGCPVVGSIRGMPGNVDRLVKVVRILFGLDLVINGLNWWVKLVTPYPSLSDFVDKPPPPDFVGAMISTGIIFHVVKGTELIAGIAVLANRFVPLALVVALPISVNVFLVDWFLAHRLRAYVMGTGALLMNLALMAAYLEYYRPLLQSRSIADGKTWRASARVADNGFTLVVERTRTALLWLAALIGLVMLVWVAFMMVERQLR
jgi:hypothetical protein